MSVYCSIEEAYGDNFFEDNIKPQPPLSIKLRKKPNNSYSDFKGYEPNLKKKFVPVNKQKRARVIPNNNFDMDDVEKDIEKKDKNDKSEDNDLLLNTHYESNNTLLLKLIDENMKLQKKIDILFQQSKRNNIIDIVLYIITGILLIIFIDMIMRRMRNFNLMS